MQIRIWLPPRAMQKRLRGRHVMHATFSRHVLFVAAAFAFATFAWAQEPATQAPGPMAAAYAPLPPGIYDRYLMGFEPLRFSGEVKSLSTFSDLSNSVFKPPGAGPFPAVVLTHSCGGVDAPQLRERARELLDAGYLVLVLDSFKPRGQKNCRNGVITTPLTSRDAVNALVHLQTLKEVDKSRIYQVGFSMGSLSAAFLASPSANAYLNTTQRFRASVGWYGSCGLQLSSTGRPVNILRADIDRPLLLLMAEQDRETPIREFCFPLLDDVKANGKPVEWHIYGGRTTHAWDSRSGNTITNVFGEKVTNEYDGMATEDAMRRTLEFLKKHP
jgi:dienelactone hydrolase